ncbi:hypothetical protein ACFYTS_26960 [Nocardia sp. NPDC004151]
MDIGLADAGGHRQRAGGDHVDRVDVLAQVRADWVSSDSVTELT